ncbi:hypothetical protein KWH19_10995 [Xanthomonas campestris pv. pennamericanum]|uniref:hypothetical protein n=1 Tax=Xanthomonas euvesicatoria TaxID=456327 RepID=UPI001C451EAE|nr:hypothetical protein [Xanthomonas euvesicatoria]MBV6810311.1 hypothetical protein [Xanthomonas campestris pv. pennamericanum]
MDCNPYCVFTPEQRELIFAGCLTVLVAIPFVALSAYKFICWYLNRKDAALIRQIEREAFVALAAMQARREVGDA